MLSEVVRRRRGRGQVFRYQIKVNGCKVKIRIFEVVETCNIVRKEIYALWIGGEVFSYHIKMNDCKVNIGMF